MTEQPLHPREWLPELALGSLDGEEAADVRAHIQGCVECRREYEAMSRVAGLLPFAAEAVAPDMGGRERLLERIRNEPREPAQFAKRPRPIRKWLAGAAAAAAVVVLLSGGSFMLGRQTSGDGLQRDFDRQEAIVIAAARGTLDVSRGEAETVRVSLVRSPSEASGFALVEGLPALPADRAYQAWFTQDGQVFEPSDVFSLADGGVWLSTRGPMEAYMALAFTIEDKGGAEAPTDEPFVVVPLTETVAMNPGFGWLRLLPAR